MLFRAGSKRYVLLTFLVICIIATISIIVYVLRETDTEPTFASAETFGMDAVKDFGMMAYLRPFTFAGQQSSYCRLGSNNDGWGSGNFLYTDDNGDKVLFDAKGPGAIKRLWFAGAWNYNMSYLKFYFDNEAVPRINISMSDLFTGYNTPFLAPLVGDTNKSSGGLYSYVTLNYQKSLRISTNAVGKDFFYHVGYSTYSPDTQIASWDPNTDSASISKLWNISGRDPAAIENEKILSGNVDLKSKDVILLPQIKGAKTITSIKLKVPGVVAPNKGNKINDDGRSIKDFSEFTMAIDPRNQGVSLIRRLDYGYPDQKATVYVDGLPAGEWFSPGSDTADRWRNSTFFIPPEFTLAKSSITIKIVNKGSVWTEFYYKAESVNSGYQFDRNNRVEVDMLDICEKSSEEQHKYSAGVVEWEGSREYSSPVPIDSEDALNNINLKIYWDNEKEASVNAPLGMFFAVGRFGISNVRSLPAGLDEENNLYIYFPMSFRKSAKIELCSSRLVDTEPIGFEIKYSPFIQSFDKIGYFKTYYSELHPRVGDGRDYTVLDTEGCGNLVGLVQSYVGDLDRQYLEGDERIYIDDSKTPSWIGTGTEDFYGGGGYFINGPFCLPFNGNSAHITDGSDKTSVYRFLITDPIPFRKHITFGLEHGSELNWDDMLSTVNNNANVDVYSLAYYYYKASALLQLTDTLDIGVEKSEADHSYKLTNETGKGTLTSTYEGNFDDVTISDYGRKHKGVSEFTLKISPGNEGILLRRTFDQSIPNQEAEVYIDGKLVGTWYRAGSNNYHKWRDDDFIIPSEFTKNKDRITVRMSNIANNADWSEYKYEAYVIGLQKH